MRTLSIILVTLALPATSVARRPLVVLDPGHGGTNHGAYGEPIGQHEKSLTLKLARRVAMQMKKLKIPARVRLTRRHDRYLTLAGRVALANEWRGDLFISLHFNASTSRMQSGFETYVLSDGASDKEAARIAQLENEGRRKRRTKDPIAAILADLEQRANHARSLRLAKKVHIAIRQRRPKAADRGVRKAPFDVLMGLRMPGVLVEAGFIDHPDESRQITRPDTFDAIARAIAEGIGAYLEGPKKVARR